MSLASEPFGVPHRTIPTRDQTSPTDAERATPFWVALQAQGLPGPIAESAGSTRPEGPGVSGAGREWEHRRDILAIMTAILTAHDGIASAKKTALLCWEEANNMARMLRESCPGGDEERQSATPGVGP
jgi:hypothetical protein